MYTGDMDAPARLSALVERLQRDGRVDVAEAALGGPMSPQACGQFAGFTAGDAKAPAARAFALDIAGAETLQGETALVALWISADAGAAGPAAGDRARIIRALKAAGLEEDARAFAVEGLLALR